MLTNKETNTQTSGHEFNTFMVEVIILLHKCALGVADVKGYLHILHQHKSFDLKLFQLRLLRTSRTQFDQYSPLIGHGTVFAMAN